MRVSLKEAKVHSAFEVLPCMPLCIARLFKHLRAALLSSKIEDLTLAAVTAQSFQPSYDGLDSGLPVEGDQTPGLHGLFY